MPCDVYVSDLDANYTPQGAPRRLTNQQTMIQGITWPHDEKSVIYGALASGGYFLWRAPLPQGKPERIELAGAGQFPTISRAGDQLAYERDRGDYDIWKFTPGGGLVSVFSSTTNDIDPQLSADGARVAFVTDRSGRGREIWIATLEGVGGHPLTQATTGYLGSPRWSPDGKWIAFDAVSDGGNWDIYVVDAAGGQPRRLTTDPGLENFPSWSRDGKWIYFRSTRTGRSEVWRMRPDGGSPEQITTTGGASAWESWDGETLYYTRHDGTGPLGDSPALLARPVTGGAERQILDAVLRWDFVPARDGIYYITVAEPRSRRGFELRFLNFGTTRSKVISRFQARVGQGLTASADGTTILYSGISSTANADLMIIHNFR
jgi:Tol biopolymer transport system component